MQKGLAIELKANISEDGEFTGYAAAFNNIDRGGDIIMPGAFTKSLKVRPASKVKLLRNHAMDEPIGVLFDAVEDSKGLKVRGRITSETVKGKETLALMRMGSLDAMSIGYRSIRDRFDRKSSARIIEELELWETSIVSIPMNPAAIVTAVKSHINEAAFCAALRRAQEALTS
jgi:HK97 family phage prohead protease